MAELKTTAECPQPSYQLGKVPVSFSNMPVLSSQKSHETYIRLLQFIPICLNHLYVVFNFFY